MSNPIGSSNRLFDLLPALFREEQDGILDALLGAFDTVLLGNDGQPEPRGLEQMIAGIDALFDPQRAPEEFLPWLAGWVAFTFQADFDVEQKRSFLGKVISLYPTRGTRRNLQAVLDLFTFQIGKAAVTEDQVPDAQLEVHSTLDKDFYLEGGPPYSFTVTLYLRSQPGDQTRQVQIAHALIDAEKPAHTIYKIIPVAQGMLLDKARLGVDTTLGTLEPN